MVKVSGFQAVVVKVLIVDFAELSDSGLLFEKSEHGIYKGM